MILFFHSFSFLYFFFCVSICLLFVIPSLLYLIIFFSFMKVRVSL